MNRKRTVFRALSVHSLEGCTDAITDKISKACESEDPGLKDFTLVPSKPTKDTDIA